MCYSVGRLARSVPMRLLNTAVEAAPEITVVRKALMLLLMGLHTAATGVVEWRRVNQAPVRGHLPVAARNDHLHRRNTQCGLPYIHFPN